MRSSRSVLGLLAARGSLFLTRPTLATYTHTREDLEAVTADLFDVVASGAVSIKVNQTYSLENAAQAHRDLEARRTTGSTVLPDRPVAADDACGGPVASSPPRWSPRPSRRQAAAVRAPVGARFPPAPSIVAASRPMTCASTTSDLATRSRYRDRSSSWRPRSPWAKYLTFAQVTQRSLPRQPNFQQTGDASYRVRRLAGRGGVL